MRIFLSSTYRDLQFERRLVREYLRKSHHIISAMETDCRTDFSWPRWSKNEAGKCDIYLRIYDRRTGTEDPEQIINLANNSITEIEYLFARPRALRCLSYQLIRPLRDIGSYITEHEMDDYLLTVNEADKFTSFDYYVRQQVESAFRKGLALSSIADLFAQLDKDLRVNLREYVLWKLKTVIFRYFDENWFAWRYVVEDERHVWSTTRTFGYKQRARLIYLVLLPVLTIFCLQWLGPSGCLLIVICISAVVSLSVLAICPTYIWIGEKSAQVRSYFGLNIRVLGRDRLLSIKPHKCSLSKLFGYTAFKATFDQCAPTVVRFVDDHPPAT